MSRTYFRVWRHRHFRSKDPTWADIAQLAVTHAQNILSDRTSPGHFLSGDWFQFRSRNFRSCAMVRSPQNEVLCPYPYTTYDGRTLTDYGRRKLDDKWWQKLTWPLTRWAKRKKKMILRTAGRTSEFLLVFCGLSTFKSAVFLLVR